MSQLTMLEAWETGCFHALLFPTEPIGIFSYISLSFGILIQLLILLKARRKTSKYIFPSLSAVLILILDIACQTVTGWDRLAWLVFYGCAMHMLLGIICVSAIVFIVKKFKNRHISG